jgi:Tfp pilus assembly protein PilW
MKQDRNIGGVSGFMGIDSQFESLEGDNNGKSTRTKKNKKQDMVVGVPDAYLYKRQAVASHRVSLPAGEREDFESCEKKCTGFF